MTEFWIVKDRRFNGDSMIGYYTKEEEARTDAERFNEVYQTDSFFVEEASRD